MSFSELFPPRENYAFFPAKQVQQPSQYTVQKIRVELCKRPVFLFALHGGAKTVGYRSLRLLADQDMRAYLREFQHTLVTKLFAISCVGPKFCVYEYNPESDSITPESPEDSYTDDEASAWWKYDISTDSGMKKFVEVAQAAKANAASTSKH